MHEGIVEPVPRQLLGQLRRAVLDHATAEGRRTLPATLRVGVPGQVVASFTLGPDEHADHALRADVVAALLRRTQRRGATPLVWLTRGGDLAEAQDADLEWCAATRAAGGELGRHLPYVLVNRRSWRDPRSGVGREWQRLRRSRGPTGPANL